MNRREPMQRSANQASCENPTRVKTLQTSRRNHVCVRAQNSEPNAPVNTEGENDLEGPHKCFAKPSILRNPRRVLNTLQTSRKQHDTVCVREEQISKSLCVSG